MEISETLIHSTLCYGTPSKKVQEKHHWEQKPFFAVWNVGYEIYELSKDCVILLLSAIQAKDTPVRKTVTNCRDVVAGCSGENK